MTKKTYNTLSTPLVAILLANVNNHYAVSPMSEHWALFMVHATQLLTLHISEELILILEIRLGLDCMEELDKVFLSFVIPLACIPFRFVYVAHQL